MTSGLPLGRKPTLCRYFMNAGSCNFGDDCQYLHQVPSGSLQNSYQNGPVPGNDSSGVGDLGNNGDEYFNATFGSMPFQQFHARTRPRSRNSLLSNLAPGATNKPYLGPPPPPNTLDQGLANDLSALTLAGNQGPSKVVTSQGPAEFIQRSGALSHSSSTPSFSSYGANMYGGNGMPPSTHLANSPAIAYSSAVSPSHSPRISPSGSPLTLRRGGSPAAPMQRLPKTASNTIQENVGGTTYFYSPEDYTPQHEGVILPNFSMYGGMPSHIHHMRVKVNMPQFFMPDEIKMELLNRQALLLSEIDPSQNPDIPQEVDSYHCLFPLEPPVTNPLQKSNALGYPTTCYKAISTKDGLHYCLRRIHGFRLAGNVKCMQTMDTWKKLYHPNIVQLREVFTTKAFNDNSIVFVYDYFPGAETLFTRHSNPTPPMGQMGHLNGFANPYTIDSGPRPPFGPGKGSQGAMNGLRGTGLLPESLIWTYIVQLSSALRAVHSAGVACRILDLSKILIYSKSRLRINCCGILDVLAFDNNQTQSMIIHYQQEDLVMLGRLVMSLACNSLQGVPRENMSAAVDLISRNYSPDLKNLVLYLLTNQNRQKSINDVMPMIGARFFSQLDAAQLRSDVIEAELSKEVDNGRLFRLLCKLGAVNERPEFNMDPAWSETGDRYMLKLFRDYLFHQVDETGAPWIDLSHIVQTLNKLDSGSMEKICLVSRDEQNVLVVSYAELKRCFTNAFAELNNPSHHTGYS